MSRKAFPSRRRLVTINLVSPAPLPPFLSPPATKLHLLTNAPSDHFHLHKHPLLLPLALPMHAHLRLLVAQPRSCACVLLHGAAGGAVVRVPRREYGGGWSVDELCRGIGDGYEAGAKREVGGEGCGGVLQFICVRVRIQTPVSVAFPLKPGFLSLHPSTTWVGGLFAG